ncbi:hypothetical protein HN51_013509, partial [Arachis hypogaea]
LRKCPGSHHSNRRIPTSTCRYSSVAQPDDLHHSHLCCSPVLSSPLVTRIPKAKPAFVPLRPPPRRSFTQRPCPSATNPVTATRSLLFSPPQDH